MLWAVAAVALIATPAVAQSGDLSGTWAFQTQPYGDQQFGVVMSGVAIATASAPNRYDIRLIANELIIERASGRSQTITARQTCTGEDAGGQFNITCQMAEPVEGYEPDNFVLQRGEADQLVGVLSSATSGQVTFTRVR
ncbi:hypothetical protein U91I_03861 [alpha proteobacterium U9-1i]|nr:hypothetical protein U91I_03861 [alpha proteobacterium U9-1i]